MELISYMITSLIVALGIFCGAALGKIAKEELKPGKKYLLLLQNLAILALVVLFVYFRNPYIALLAAIVFVGRMTYGNIAKEPKMHFYYLAYAVFALIFFASSKEMFFIAASSLMFVFGLPTGSLLFMKKGWINQCLYLALLFFVLSILLFTTLHLLF